LAGAGDLDSVSLHGNLASIWHNSASLLKLFKKTALQVVFAAKLSCFNKIVWQNSFHAWLREGNEQENHEKLLFPASPHSISM